MSQNCPAILANGTCPDPHCTYNHNVLSCEPCQFIAPTRNEYDAHIQTRPHANRIAGRSAIVSCPICDINVGIMMWKSHVSGARHRAAMKANRIIKAVLPVTASSRPGSEFCSLCQENVPESRWQRHLSAPHHLRREQYQSFKVVLEETEKDKHGISIEGIFDFDVVEPEAATLGKVQTATIKSSVPLSNVFLVAAKLASAQGAQQLASSFSVTIAGGINKKITPSNPIRFTVILRQQYIGRYEDRLELVFEDTQLKKRFILSRALKAIVGNKAEHEALRPTAPYIPRPRRQRQAETHVVEGIAPPSLNAIPYVVKLPPAVIPKHLLDLLSGDNSTTQKVRDVKRRILPNSLDSETYARHFKNLIWIEEHKSEEDLQRYDMANATLTKHQSYYYLDVPGLAEKRPSVLVGDNILVQSESSNSDHWFAGGVHVIRQYEVGLRFAGSFSGWSAAARYNIRFKLNRIPFRRQHQALDTVFTQARVLFPLVEYLDGDSAPGPLGPIFNTLISKNVRQLQAVASIVKQPPGSVPFVVFGPPGTGKTITIVEAIRQLLRSNPRAKVLACAPSNSAADLIANRLTSGLTKDQLFRFYAPSRFKSQVPDELLDYTYIRPDGHFSVPPMARMKQFRVVVTTCNSASIIFGIGIPRGHYSHIFIDEAGQATEPEAFISIKTIADNDTNIILSGDPKQLGPIIRSPIARQLGLEVSYLERLMNRDVYDVESGYGKSVVKLVKNFRSHPAILRFPNDRFYGSELEPCANPQDMNYYLNSSLLPTKQFPIIFHAVSGNDDREASSPSFFNREEVLQVKAYVEKLRGDRQCRTTDKDIGIIAPYHAQCLKIRTVLRNVADGVKVGSVEEFQGQERPVMIISTVRSSKEFVEYDLRHTLGFVANPRRFNVAVTRAKALLIVVGDPQVLSLDPLWRSFLNYIHLNNGWVGPPPTWDTLSPVDEAGDYAAAIRENALNEMSDFTRRMEELTIAGVAESEDVDVDVDLPWRDTE